MNQRILIVEDEAKIARLLIDYLQEYGGYDCRQVADGNEVMSAVRQYQPDLILLDIMLPGKDGVAVAKELVQEFNIPFVMVTARVEEVDRLIGLEIGADDYICKPFSPREVVIRVRNILKRAGDLTESTPAQLVVNRDAAEAKVSGKALKLTPVEFSLLEFLAARPRRVFSRDQLMSRIYADYRVVSDRTVDTHVKNLRKKLKAIDPDNDYVESIYSVGYRFTGAAKVE